MINRVPFVGEIVLYKTKDDGITIEKLPAIVLEVDNGDENNSWSVTLQVFGHKENRIEFDVELGLGEEEFDYLPEPLKKA